MKKIFGLVSMVIILFACTQKGEYKVVGTVADSSLDGKSVYLTRINSNGIEKSDTTSIHNGKFEFHGKQDMPEVYYVFMNETEGEMAQGIPVLIHSGKIAVNIQKDKVVVGGNPETDAYQKMMDEQRPFIEKMKSIDKQFREGVSKKTMTPEVQAGLEKEVEATYKQIRDITADYIFKNINNPLGQEIFLTRIQFLTLEEKIDVLDKSNEMFKSRPEVLELQAAMEMEKKVAVGQLFTDFVLPDAQGKEVTFSNYVGKGKYVLLDFWASWCQPCIKEMPTLVKAYQFYQGKNFEIVGVSLDKDKDAWLNAVKNLHITWPQLSDLQDCLAATQPYMVSSIPHTLLIDPQGKIIAKDLRGNALIEKLEEVLK